MKNLTSRENEVLQEVLKAKRRIEIASDLKISINTLDKHLNHIYRKTSTRSSSELIVLYFKKFNS